MILAVQLVAWFIALPWLWKAITAAFGSRRIPNLTLAQFNVSPPNAPSLTVIVPARDEAANIAATLNSLLAQDYPNLQILAVDDRSTDGTGAIIDTIASGHPTRLRAIHISELPAGWLGKTHALAFAARTGRHEHRSRSSIVNLVKSSRSLLSGLARYPSILSKRHSVLRCASRFVGDERLSIGYTSRRKPPTLTAFADST